MTVRWTTRRAGLALAILACAASARAAEEPEVEGLFRLSLEELMSVSVVTATRTALPLVEAPATMAVITAAQIRARGYRSVGEALESVAGLDLLQDHVQYNMGVRGVSGGQAAWSRGIKVMIDGQAVAFRPTSQEFLGEELVPIALVERIELVRGPASALYGADAFLGVVNVITRSAESLDGFEVGGRIGQVMGQAAYGAEVAVGRRAGPVSFLGGASWSRADRSGLAPVNVPGSPHYGPEDTSQNDQQAPGSAFARLGVETPALGALTLDLSFQRLRAGGEFQDWATLTHNNLVALENLSVRARWEKALTERAALSLSLAASHGAPAADERLNTSDTEPGWIIRQMEDHGLDAAAEVRWKLGERGSLVLGTDLRVDDQRLLCYASTDSTGVVTPIQGIDPGHRTFTNAGFYAQTLIHPLTWLAPAHERELGLTAGLRLDDNSQYGQVLDWRLGLTWQPLEWLGAKLLYGTSFQAPSPAQLYANRMQPLGAESNPDLQPERARTAELGVTLRAGPHLAFTGSAYYLHIVDKVQLILPSGPVATVRPENVSEVKSLGVEGELVLQAGDTSAFLNASLQDAEELRQDPALGQVWVSSPLYPAQMFKAGVTQRVPLAHLSVYLEARWTGQRLASDPTSFLNDPLNYRTSPYAIPGYALADLTIASDRLVLFGPNETSVWLRITDLADAGGTYPGFRDCDIPGLGRTVTLAVRQRF